MTMIQMELKNAPRYTSMDLNANQYESKSIAAEV